MNVDIEDSVGGYSNFRTAYRQMPELFPRGRTGCSCMPTQSHFKISFQLPKKSFKIKVSIAILKLKVSAYVIRVSYFSNAYVSI